jgi:two-component system, sensor histidine kinase and response regulator
MIKKEKLQPLILTIDDESIIRKSFKDFLEDANFRVVEAENGARGIEVCFSEDPDLILLDLSMPEMDGFEVLELLTVKKPDTPIIVVSGIGVLRDAIKALRMGAWDYLLKPLEDLSMLEHAVEKCLERARLIDENKAYQENLENEVARRTQELDLTVKKLNETNIQLTTSENRFRTLADTSSAAIMMYQNNELVYINSTVERISGYSMNDLKILEIKDVLYDSSDKTALQKIKRISEEKPDYFREEIRIITKNKEERWIDVSGGYTELQGALSIIVSFMDTTDRRTYEETLKNINRELESRVAERTSELELTNKKLQTAKAKADDATEAKSSFLANMSHEIRTPMNGVIAAVELALQQETSPEVNRFLKIIHSSGYSLLGIINDILDFSKIEAGKLDLEEKPFLLNEAINNAINPFISNAFEKNIDLLIDIKPDIPGSYSGDQLRIIQILSNLLSNSIKFTDPRGSVTVGARISKLMTEPGLIELLFFVKDTGIGLSAEQQEKIFQPFTQADISTTRKFGGTGLGLSISKKLAELMGGQIWFQSSQNVGTTFYFTALLHLQNEKPLYQHPQVENLASSKILVINDNRESTRLLVEILKSFKMTVESIDPGKEAIELIDKNRGPGYSFNVIAIDYQMLGSNGLEPIQVLREKAGDRLPVIILAGIGPNPELDSYVKNNQDVFLLHKPFNPSSVFNCLMVALGYSSTDYHSGLESEESVAKDYKVALKGLQILVADDNPTNQEIAQAILEKAGISVSLVENGQEALDAVDAFTFDAVLMDVQMPIMDGYKATQIIRNQLQNESLPIIAMTAHAMKGDEEKCLEAGMNGYIAKPINQKKLFETLALHIKTDTLVPTPDQSEVEEPSELNLPDVLPGLEIKNALKNLKLGKTVYLRIIEKFYLFHKSLVNQLDIEFGKRNWENLRNLFHNIKGSANNIGAYQAGKLAHELESEIEKCNDSEIESSQIKKHIKKLKEAMTEVLDTIEQLSGQKPILPPPKWSPDQNQSSLEFIDLKKALNSLDPVKIKKALEELKSKNNSMDIKTLEDKIGNYDYDDALKLLDQLKP